MAECAWTLYCQGSFHIFQAINYYDTSSFLFSVLCQSATPEYLCLRLTEGEGNCIEFNVCTLWDTLLAVTLQHLATLSCSLLQCCSHPANTADCCKTPAKPSTQPSSILEHTFHDDMVRGQCWDLLVMMTSGAVVGAVLTLWRSGRTPPVTGAVALGVAWPGHPHPAHLSQGEVRQVWVVTSHIINNSVLAASAV